MLTRVRQAIRKALQDATEVIAYQIPAYPLAGRVPVGLIARIARLRAREVAERALARHARTRRRRTSGAKTSTRPTKP